MGKWGDFGDTVADLNRDLDDAHERATGEAVDEMERAVTAGVSLNQSVAREVLLRSIRSGPPTRPRNGHSKAVKMPEWAKYLEHGTGARGATDTVRDHETYDAPDPGPPLEDIYTWVVEKNVQPRNFDSQLALATAIQEVIGALGTFPHPFYRPVWYSTRVGWRNVVTKNHTAMERTLSRHV